MTITMKKPRSPKKTDNAEIRVRLDAETKNLAEEFFRSRGLSTGDGMRLLIKRAIENEELWPDQETASLVPNAETQEAMHDVRAGRTERVSLDELKMRLLGDT